MQHPPAWAQGDSRCDAAAIVDFLEGLVSQVETLDAAAAPAQCERQCKTAPPEPDWQCAICLCEIQVADLSIVQGCEHSYCVKCILQWATGRKDASCPTCKAPFDSLLVHRDVDGALSDVPIRETVAFLARAPWYVAWAREQSQIRELTRQHAAFRSVDVAASERSPLAIAQEEWAEEAMYGYFEDQYDDDDEELEDYYVGRRGRPTFGNRPWGPGGFVSSGRRRAAPVQPPRAGKGGASSSGSGTSSSGKGGGAKSGGKGGGGSSAGPSAQGRRAKRNAKRAAAGYGDD